MSKLLLDAGTTWSKVYEIHTPETKSNPLLSQYLIDKNTENNISTYILPSAILKKLDIYFDAATGHMAKTRIKENGKFENEVIALAYGAQKILNNPEDAIILDLGSRDSKWVRFKDGKYKDLDWNTNCGSATGATVEMLLKYYELNNEDIPIVKTKIPVTCGVFGMEKIMDLVANGTSPDIAVSQYIHGIAYNTWCFAKKPDKLYLSGGFCLNNCFVNSLQKYCEVELLGRFVLLEGLFI